MNSSVDIIEIEGVHDALGTEYHSFCMSHTALYRLAAVLETVTPSNSPLTCRIGGYTLRFDAGRRERGSAGYNSAGDLTLYSNMADLRYLAEHLRAIADQEETESVLPHAHLAETYFDASDVVKDIEFYHTL